jgi:hypothetical protein
VVLFLGQGFSSSIFGINIALKGEKKPAEILHPTGSG